MESYLRIMGHELRTPLQSLSMFIEVMRRESEQGRPSPKDSFLKVRSQLDRLSKLVTDLMEASPVGGLPVSPEPMDPGQRHRENSGGHLRQWSVSRILIVDDDMAILDALGTLLRDRYDVVMASNGQEALDRLGQTPVDLVVLDMAMPFLDGEGALREIRDRGMKTPVIVASARSDRLADFKALGADDFIQKPFDVGLLEEKIDRLLAMAAS